jgi:hypothetical protein
MSATVILAPGTAAANSTAIEVGKSACMLALSGALMTGAEVLPIQYSPDNGATWLAMLDRAGTVQFSVTVTAIPLEFPGLYRAARPLLTTNTGVVAFDAPFRS